MPSSRLEVVVPMTGPIDRLHLLLRSLQHSSYDLSQMRVTFAGDATQVAAAARLRSAPGLSVERRFVLEDRPIDAVRHALMTAPRDGYVLFAPAGQVFHPEAVGELVHAAQRHSTLTVPVTNLRGATALQPPHGASHLDFRVPNAARGAGLSTVGVVPASVAATTPPLRTTSLGTDFAAELLRAWEGLAGERRLCRRAFAFYYGSLQASGGAVAASASAARPKGGSRYTTTAKHALAGYRQIEGVQELAVYSATLARRTVAATRRRMPGPASNHDQTIAGAPKAPMPPPMRKRSAPQQLDGPPSVVYLLPSLGRWGGVISVLQLVNRMVVRGIDANVASFSITSPKLLREPMLFRPHLFRSRREMVRRLRPYDVVVAASWDTVFDAIRIQERTSCTVANFVQDFDPDVHAAGSRNRALAQQSLEIIEHKIVKSRWLADRVRPYGGTVHQIPLGLNLDIFHPRSSDSDGTHRVLVAARPKVPVRNLDGALEILTRLQVRRPNIRAVFMGRPFEVPDRLNHHHLGELTQAGVAEALRSVDVLLDPSLFQGFGRPGLEAMACGVPAVVTSKGGINEYAVSGRNCLQVDPNDLDGFVDAIEQVFDDPGLRASLRDNGVATAAQYDAESEAERTIELFTGLVRHDV